VKVLAWIVLVLVAGLFSFTVFWDWTLRYRIVLVLTWKPRKRQTPEEKKEE
jgi:hypothetical protein